MQLTVNGELHNLAEPLSLGQLLTRLGIASGRVAVEVNEDVVPRGTYETHPLAGGDRVEIVHFVGGG